MPAGPPKHVSTTEVARLMRDYEARLRDVLKLQLTEATEADEGVADKMLRKARLAVLVEIKELMAKLRRLEGERNHWVKEKSRLNTENRALADIAIAERERFNSRLGDRNGKDDQG